MSWAPHPEFPASHWKHVRFVFTPDHSVLSGGDKVTVLTRFGRATYDGQLRDGEVWVHTPGMSQDFPFTMDAHVEAIRRG
jgi:hypothetical protein